MNNGDAEAKKKIDEDWKEQVEREKSQFSEPSGHEQTNHGADRTPGSFTLFVSSLAYQALAAMGHAPESGGDQSQKSLEQANYLIDILSVLEEKTRGNLTKEESDTLSTMLYELRMKYVEESKRGSA